MNDRAPLTDHLPRHIAEHAKHCAECQANKCLCAEGRKLLAEFEIIKNRIDKLPKLKDIA